METFSALLAHYEGDPSFTGGFASQRPISKSDQNSISTTVVLNAMLRNTGPVCISKITLLYCTKHRVILDRNITRIACSRTWSISYHDLHLWAMTFYFPVWWACQLGWGLLNQFPPFDISVFFLFKRINKNAAFPLIITIISNRCRRRWAARHLLIWMWFNWSVRYLLENQRFC